VTDNATRSRPGVVILNWRDTRNPEGGGSELYAEQVATWLARRGHRVTIFCASHGYAPADEVTSAGVRIVRRGTRLGVYLRAAWHHLLGRFGDHRVVVDVQNGMPFLARLYTRKPVVVLVHHVHREQWRVVLGPLAARFGWWVESWLSPRVHRRCRYVAVSEVTKHELGQLGVGPDRVTVVHNGTPQPVGPPVARAPHPRLLVLGRLVPHKRIELALAALASVREDHPDAELVVAGRGWWLDPLRAEAVRLGLADRVRFAGYVDEREKHDLLGSSWVHLVPSVKEGWGLSVVEAAAHGLPSVAFADAGGVAESIRHGRTGLLAADAAEFVNHTGRLLDDPVLRDLLGTQARRFSAAFTWDETGRRFAQVLDEAMGLPPDPELEAPHAHEGEDTVYVVDGPALERAPEAARTAREPAPERIA
jgi:glycosyltransferase involved in cell wall biosynthesis